MLGGGPILSLPIKTSADDVLTVASYLKRKATGATVAEAKAALKPKLLDGRKLAAYETWGFVLNDGNKLKLSSSGRELARATDSRKIALFAEVVSKIKPYKMAMEWASYQGFDQVDSSEVAAHWYEHSSEELGTANENAIRDQVVCFFNLAQAAGLGTYHVGRRGQTTRLEIARDALRQFIEEEGTHEPPESEESETENDELDNGTEEVEEEPSADTPQRNSGEKPIAEGNGVGQAIVDIPRVFISHSENTEIVDQIKTMLELADLKYEVAVEEETAAIPVPEKVLAAMRRCTAAAICVTADERLRRDDGTYAISENVLIEIGSAFVLYDKKVILVWDRRLSVPSNLQGLYRSEFEGNELSWSAGMKLMKAVNNFKK